MGMFDYVNFTMPCPECGSEMKDWQTKSTECTMATIDPQETADFYGDCDECGAWIDFTRKLPPPDRWPVPYTLELVKGMGFQMEVTPKRKSPQKSGGE